MWRNCGNLFEFIDINLKISENQYRKITSELIISQKTQLRIINKNT